MLYTKLEGGRLLLKMVTLLTKNAHFEGDNDIIPGILKNLYRSSRHKVLPRDDILSLKLR